MSATVGQARDDVAARLAAAGVASPAVDAELLLAHVLGCARPQVRLRRTEALTVQQARDLEGLAARRAAREPLQRLLGEVGFRRLTLTVADDVLVPRPETEVLAGHAIAATPPGAIVVEVGTGSGAIALAVADEARPGLVLATEASPPAVAAARANARRHGLRVDVRAGDLLAPVPEGLRGRVAVLVSNPPYLTEAERQAAPLEVARHDPAPALVAGPTGHEVTDRLLAAATSWLAPGGTVLLEVAEARATAVAARAEATGLVDVAVHPDLTGRPRVVAARRAPRGPRTA